MTQTASSARILIVDDSEDSADITAAYLEEGGFSDVSFAHSAREAYAKIGIEGTNAEPASFDLIIMDIRMPEVDGIEACARMRLDPASRHVPILMLSGVREVDALNQAFVAGANDFVNKPVSQIDLIARVRTLLRFRREQLRRQSREAELENLNRDLQQQTMDRALIESTTRLPSRLAVEMALRSCQAGGEPAALAIVQLDEFANYLRLHGGETTRELLGSVTAVVAAAPAPLIALPCYYGGGAFMVVHPAATGDGALKNTCDAIRAGIDVLRIPHGNSTRREFVTASVVTAWAGPDDIENMLLELGGHATQRAA